MEHLYNSVVRVERLELTNVDGVAVLDWVQATDEDPNANAMLAYLECRLDLGFLRPGKDIAPAPEAGKAPDRIGVMFTYPYAPVRAGDRFVAIPNAEGEIPVAGTFESRLKPDEAIDFSTRHHLEIQIIETNQNLRLDNWPSDDPEDVDDPDDVMVPDP